MNTMNWLSKPALTTCGMLMAAAALSQPKNAANKPLPLDTAVHTGRLANGFTYYIRHNASPEKRVVLYLVCKAGSILETEEQRGMAHFIEHMSFNGTKHFPKNALVDYLQKSGVRFGADLNAYTSFDETVYQLPLRIDNPELLQNGLQIMRDWAQDATLDAREIESERGVVLEEERLGKGAKSRISELMMPMVMNHSRYAERLPIGKDSVLKYGKPETFRRFYNDWYRPNLQALIVVGDIDVAAMEAQVKKLFATLKNPANEKPRTQYHIPLTGKNQFMVATDAEITGTSADILIKLPGVQLLSVADYRQSIVQQLLNQLLQQRLSEAGRQSNPPYLSCNAGIQDFMNQLQAFGISVNVANGALEKGLKAAWREVERVQRFGFTDAEFNRAKQAYLAGFTASFKEKSKIASDQYVKEYVQYFLHGIAAPGMDKEYALVAELLPTITAAELSAMLKAALKNTDRDIQIQAPEKEKQGLPDEALVNTWLQQVQQEPLEAHKEEAIVGSLLATKPAPGKITGIQQPAAGVTAYTLSNGVKVILKPTDFRKGEISFSAFAPGGTSLYSDADFQSAAAAAGIVGMGGVGNYSGMELGKLLTGKQVMVSPYISERAQGFSGQASPDDLETALQLVYLYATAPRKDAAMFQNGMLRNKAGLANRSSDPNSVFADTIAGVLGNYHLRRTGPTPEKIEQVNLDRAFAIYKERFADASGFTFVLVGNIDTTTIKPLLETYLGSLPATWSNTVAKDLGIHLPAGKISRTVYKGKEDKATVRLCISGDYTYSDENNMLLQALSKTLGIRLVQRLREEEGGVYSPSCNVNFGKVPQASYMFTISFGCSPANVEKLIAITLEEMKQLRANGPAQVNLDKFKAESRTSLANALQTNGFWMGYLNSQYQHHEPLNAIDGQPQLLSNLTVQQVQKAAAQYVTEDNFIRLVLLPETGK